MKRCILAVFLIFMLSRALYAEQIPELSLRFSKQDNSARIVLEGDERFIKNSNTSVAATSLKIDFPGKFSLIKPKNFPYETAIKENMLTILLKEAADVKVSRLTSPSRLVLDVTTGLKTVPGMPSGSQQNIPGQLSEHKDTPKEKAAKESGPKPSPGATQKPQTPPILLPEYFRTIKTVVIDAGHGGYDFGLHIQDIREKDAALVLAKDLGAALSKKGIAVHFTRRTDQFLPLVERVNFTNSKNPDIFLSIHASPTDKFAFYISKYDDTNSDAVIRLYSLFSRQIRVLDKSRALATAVMGSVKSGFAMEAQFRELPLPVLNSVGSPAVLIEFPDPKSFISDQKERDRFTGSVLRGISTYEQ